MSGIFVFTKLFSTNRVKLVPTLYCLFKEMANQYRDKATHFLSTLWSYSRSSLTKLYYSGSKHALIKRAMHKSTSETKQLSLMNPEHRYVSKWLTSVNAAKNFLAVGFQHHWIFSEKKYLKFTRNIVRDLQASCCFQITRSGSNELIMWVSHIRFLLEQCTEVSSHTSLHIISATSEM